MADAPAARKAIFITGGASGIGRATAQQFASKGWFVGLADVNERGMAQTAALLPAGSSSIHPLDVRDRAQWAEALRDFAVVSGGRLDVLFNNAGIGLGGNFESLSPDDADKVIDINFRGVVNGIYAALPMLRATPGATILNTASASAIYGSPGLSIYSATKFAVRALTEALDAEFAGDGIRVRDLVPGFIDTPLLDNVVPGSNDRTREKVAQAGLEITPVERVSEAAWAAVHGDTLHTLVGKTARRLTFAARWMPGRLRKQLSRGGGERLTLGQ